MAKRSQNDHWAALAKKQGYPARSVFKLEEILQKYPLVKSGDKVLDLGAAPGGFSLYLAKKCQCDVVSCDLKKLEISHPHILEIQGDFTQKAVLERIQPCGPFALVVSDAAPSTTGDRLTDCARSLALVRQAWAIAQKLLSNGGHFMAKIFEHGDEREFMAQLGQYFHQVKAVRPKAIRNESMEFYIVALQYNKK